jgi:hypothetical protein
MTVGAVKYTFRSEPSIVIMDIVSTEALLNFFTYDNDVRIFYNDGVDMIFERQNER